MSKKSKAPPMPAYVAPAPYVAPPDPQKEVPATLTPLQVMQQGAEVEAQLPSWLQLGKDPMNPESRAQYESNYDQLYNQPALASAANDLYNNGQAYGSFAGAAVGQQAAMGQLTKYQAGLDYANGLYNQVLQGRQSYYAGGPTIATNQNNTDIQRGLGIASLQSSNANSQNNYNLGSSGQQNGFNQTNYQNQVQQQQFQQQQKQNQALGIGGLILGGLTGGARLLGGIKSGAGAATSGITGSAMSGPVGLTGYNSGSIGDFGLGLGRGFS